MRQCLLFALLFICFSVDGQDWETAYQQLEGKFRAGDYAGVVSDADTTLSTIDREKGKDTAYANVLHYAGYSAFLLGDYTIAIDLGSRERSIRAEIQGRKDPNYGYITFLLAIYKTYAGDWQEAANLAEEAVQLEEELYGRETPDYVNMAMQRATIAGQTGEFDLAEDAYLDLVDAVENVYSEEDSVYHVAINSITAFYSQNGRYEKAEPYFRKGVKMVGKIYGEESDAMLISLSSLGEFYLNAGWYAKSEKIFRESRDLTEKVKGRQSIDYSTALNNIAVVMEQQGNYTEAIEYYNESLRLKESLGYTSTHQYALNLSNLGVVYDNLGRYGKAKSMQLKALEVYGATSGEESHYYASALGNLGSACVSLAQFDTARQVLEQALGIHERVAGRKSQGYLSSLNNLATLFTETGNYYDAIESYTQILELRKELQGEIHTDVATTLSNLAHVQGLMGQVTDAEQNLHKALDIHKQTVGRKHVSYANTLNSLANHYFTFGRFDEAEKAYYKCGEIYLEIFGKEHPGYATYLNNVGLFYYETGKYILAEKSLTESLRIHERLFGKEHPGNVNALSNLANVYLNTGEYAKTEQYLRRSMKLVESNHGKNHPDYASLLNSVGTLYYEMGSYDRSMVLYQEALKRRGEIFGKDHPEYSTSLNNLGSVYMAKSTFSNDPDEQLKFAEDALLCFQQALAIDSLTLSKDHPDFSYRYNNIAEANRLLGNWDVAKKLYHRSIEIEKKNFGPDYPNIASTYHNLALVHIWDRDFEKGKQYALKSLDVYRKNYGAGHTEALSALMNTGYAFEMSGDLQGAEDYYLKGLRANYEFLEKNFGFMSEEERSNMLVINESFTRMFTGFALKRQQENPQIAATAYDVALTNKGLLLRSSNEMKMLIEQSGDANLKKIYDEWQDQKSLLSRSYAVPLVEREHDIDSLKDAVNTTEKKLVKGVSTLDRSAIRIVDGWKNIQQVLNKDAIAIEFVQYDIVTEDNESRQMYAAALLEKSKAPRIVELFNAADFRESFHREGGSDKDYVSELYGEGERRDRLFDLIWGKLIPHMEGAKDIYFSPVGMLHKVAFRALCMDAESFPDARLHQLSSTWKLTDTLPVEPELSLAVYGGALYNTPDTETKVWKYLEGTKEEAERLRELAGEAGIPVSVYLGEDASESAFKKDESSASVIHIATHGFFYADPKQVSNEQLVMVEDDLDFRGSGIGVSSFVENPDPMMRSGLVFSGANDVWSAGTVEGDDGVLTALEVSTMDLSSTDLVVMSACETGLGDVHGAEGVYGLQRAFKLAGVRYLIMSLWQVPDKETREFMVSFYGRLVDGEEINRAFYATQIEMKEKYPPYYWGAFVLVN